MTEQAIDYVEPFIAAFRRMQALLFRPFDLIRWLTIGFTAWLATLGEGGGSFNFNFPSPSSSRRKLPSAGLSTFWHEYFWIILGVGAVVLVLALALGLALLWLSARGKFMFLDNAVTGRAEVAAPWRQYRRQGHSLFLWLVVYGLVVLAVVLLIAGVGVALAWPAIRARAFGASAVVGIAVSALLLLVFMLVNGYVAAFLVDFIVPLMYKHDLRTNAAWRLWLPLWRARPGAFLLYGLLRLVFGVALGLGVLLIACLTCCCCCGLLIPYVNAVILLPVLAWERYWGPEFLRQFGPDYDVWLAAPPPLLA
ncbi:MAG: hypothetical protein NTV49_02760 [Kiritimatiellaeota bacterium]|nr:hypothetical protein [Kiritimatiellota bacterium]